MIPGMGHAPQRDRLARLVPWVVAFLCLIFAAVNTTTALQARGVADSPGYVWNNAQYIPANTYEDDGRYSIIFGLYPSRLWDDAFRQFNMGVNCGGPYFLLGALGMHAAHWLGAVEIFESPLTYAAHPDQYRRIWKLYGLLRTWLLALWFPAVMYLLGARHFSRTTGLLAAVLLVAIPFPTGFEARLKVDGPAIMLGLLAMHFQLDYLRRPSRRALVAAAALLGVSLSMKFNMVPAVFTGLAVVIVGLRRADPPASPRRLGREMAVAAGVCAGAFFAANPLALAGLVHYVGHFLAFQDDLGRSPGNAWGSVLDSVLFRMRHFGTFYGPLLGALALPSMAFAGIAGLLRVKSGRGRARLLFLLFALAYPVYMALATKAAPKHMAYYYYAEALVLLMPMADMLAALLERAWAMGRPAVVVTGLLVAIPVVQAAMVNAQVLDVWTSPTNRQQAYAWLETNAPPGATVGVRSDTGLFEPRVRMDPFRYRLAPVGNGLQHLERHQPDILIWHTRLTSETPPDLPGYECLAVYDTDADLPPEDSYRLYQAEPYAIYLRTAPTRDPGHVPWEAEAALGRFLRHDPAAGFRVLNWHAIDFMSQWLNLMRWDGNTLAYDGSWEFMRQVSPANPNLSIYAFIGDMDPALLNAWDVKYVVLPATHPWTQALDERVVADPVFGLEELAPPQGMQGRMRLLLNSRWSPR